MEIKELNPKNAKSMVIVIGGSGNQQQTVAGLNIPEGTIPMGVEDTTTLSDSYDTQAEMLITQINSGVYSIGMLTQDQKYILYRYFAKYNPILNRSLSLFVKIITSSITIQKPKEVDNDVVQDYVHAFFNRFIKHTELGLKMKNILFNFWLYQRAYILVESDYKSESDTDIDLSEDILLGQVSEVSPENQVKIDEIIKKYNDNPKSTTKAERDFVISECLLAINPNYKGLKRIRVIDPLEIAEISSNTDIGFKTYKIRKSENVQEYLGRTYSSTPDSIKKYDELIKMGYTSGYLEKYKNSDDDYIEITNDFLDEDGCFMVEFTSENSGVNMDAILIDLISYQNLLQKQKEKTLNMNKKMKLVSAPNASLDDFALLNAQISAYSSTPSGVPLITANFEVTVEDLDFDQRTQYEDESEEDITRRIITGIGMPDSLLTGQDTYGGSFLKLETMETEFATVRDDLAYMVEENLFLPVAIQKGFISSDLWGNLLPIKPRLDFKVGSIINKQSWMDFLQSMVDSKKLPEEYLLDYIGFDSEEVNQKLKEEQDRKAEMGIDNGGEDTF